MFGELDGRMVYIGNYLINCNLTPVHQGSVAELVSRAKFLSSEFLVII